MDEQLENRAGRFANPSIAPDSLGPDFSGVTVVPKTLPPLPPTLMFDEQSKDWGPPVDPEALKPVREARAPLPGRMSLGGPKPRDYRAELDDLDDKPQTQNGDTPALQGQDISPLADTVLRWRQQQRQNDATRVLTDEWLKGTKAYADQAEAAHVQAQEALEDPQSTLEANALKAQAEQAARNFQSAKAWNDAVKEYEAYRIQYADQAFRDLVSNQGERSGEGLQASPIETPKAFAHGAVSGTGQAISGTGLMLQGMGANAQTFLKQQLSIMDKIDAGGVIRRVDDFYGYGDQTPEQKADTRKMIGEQLASGDVSGLKAAGQKVRNVGDPIQKFAENTLAIDPSVKNSFLVRSADMAGGFVPYMTVAALTGVPGVMAVAGAQAYESAFQEAKAKGASDEDAHRAASISALTNAGLMSIPMSRWMGGLPELFKDSMLRAATTLATEGVVLTSVMQAQKLLDNVVAKTSYDPERKLNDGLGENIPEQLLTGILFPAGSHAVHQTYRGIVESVRQKKAEKAEEAAQAPPPTPEEQQAKQAEAVQHELEMQRAHVADMATRGVPEDRLAREMARVEELKSQVPKPEEEKAGEVAIGPDRYRVTRDSVEKITPGENAETRAIAERLRPITKRLDELRAEEAAVHPETERGIAINEAVEQDLPKVDRELKTLYDDHPELKAEVSKLLAADVREIARISKLRGISNEEALRAWTREGGHRHYQQIEQAKAAARAAAPSEDGSTAGTVAGAGRVGNEAGLGTSAEGEGRTAAQSAGTPGPGERAVQRAEGLPGVAAAAGRQAEVPAAERGVRPEGRAADEHGRGGEPNAAGRAASPEQLRREVELDGIARNFRARLSGATGELTARELEELKAKGFDVSAPLYHGSNFNFSDFDPKQLGRQGGGGWGGENDPGEMNRAGAFVSPSLEEAQDYGKHVYKIYGRPGKQKIIAHNSSDPMAQIRFERDLLEAKAQGYDSAVLRDLRRPDMHEEHVFFNPAADLKIAGKVGGLERHEWGQELLRQGASLDEIPLIIKRGLAQGWLRREPDRIGPDGETIPGAIRKTWTLDQLKDLTRNPEDDPQIIAALWPHVAARLGLGARESVTAPAPEHEQPPQKGKLGKLGLAPARESRISRREQAQRFVEAGERTMDIVRDDKPIGYMFYSILDHNRPKDTFYLDYIDIPGQRLQDYTIQDLRDIRNAIRKLHPTVTRFTGFRYERGRQGIESVINAALGRRPILGRSGVPLEDLIRGIGEKPLYVSDIPGITQYMTDALNAGKTVNILGDVQANTHMALAAHAHMLPAGSDALVLSRIEPIGDGKVKAIFTNIDGSQKLEYPIAWLRLQRGRAFNLGRNAFFIRFADRPFLGGTPGAVDRNHGAEVGHEVVHILKRSGALDDGTWGRLLDHANRLNLMDQPLETYFRAIGDEEGANRAKGSNRTAGDEYRELYANRKNLQDKLDQEQVAHMNEWWLRGLLSDKEVVPVLDLLQALKSGELAGHGRGKAGRIGEEPYYAAGSPEIVGAEQRRALNNLGMYSALDEAVKNLKQAKGTPEQMLAQLKKALQVKDAEIKARGLDRFFAERSEGKKNTITKKEIVDHLEKNRVEVREARYGGERVDWPDSLRDAARRQFRDAADNAAIYEAYESLREGVPVEQVRSRLAERAPGRPLQFFDEQYAHVTLQREAGLSGSARWSQYSIDPSNPTNRETVLHLPESQRWADINERRVVLNERSREIAKELDRLGVPAIERSRGARATSQDHPLQQEWQRLHDEDEALRAEREGLRGFRDAHFPDQPNPIIHLGTSLQKTLDGKLVGVADRAQAQWAQNIRDAQRNAYANKLFGPEAPGIKERIAEAAKAAAEATAQRQRAVGEVDQFVRRVDPRGKGPTTVRISDIVGRSGGNATGQEARRLLEAWHDASNRERQLIDAHDSLRSRKTYRDLTDEQKKQVSAAISDARKKGETIEGVRDEAKIADLKKQIADIEANFAKTHQPNVRRTTDDPEHPFAIFLGDVPFGYASKTKAGAQARIARGFNPEIIRTTLHSRDPELRRLFAELRTAESASPSHPLVNTTEAAMEFGIKRLVRQFIEADVDRIAISPAQVLIDRMEGAGQEKGMKKFYDEIFPRAMLKYLKSLDPSITQSEMPLKSSMDGRTFTRKQYNDLNPDHGNAQEILDEFEGNFDAALAYAEANGYQETIEGLKRLRGDASPSAPPIQFHTFALTDKVKQKVLDEGQAMFAIRGGRQRGEEDERPTPPPASGVVRMYHGGVNDERGIGLDFISDLDYAKGYAAKSPGGRVSYVDVPEDHPLIKPEYADQGYRQGFTINRKLPAEIADQRKPFIESSEERNRAARIDNALTIAADRLGVKVPPSESSESQRIFAIANQAGSGLLRILGPDFRKVLEANISELQGYAPLSGDPIVKRFAEWARDYIAWPDVAERRAPEMAHLLGDYLDTKAPALLQSIEVLREASRAANDAIGSTQGPPPLPEGAQPPPIPSAGGGAAGPPPLPPGRRGPPPIPPGGGLPPPPSGPPPKRPGRIRSLIASALESRLAGKIVEGAQDLSHPVRKLQQELEARRESPFTDTDNFYTKKRLYPGRVGNEVNEFNHQHLDPLTDLMSEYKISLQEAGDYVYAKHVAERNARLARLYPLDHPFQQALTDPTIVGASGRSQGWADRILAKADRTGRMGVLEDVSDRIQAIRAFVLDRLETDGLITPENAQNWRDQYQHYVDLRGFEDAPDEAPSDYREPARFNIRGKETRQAFGRRSKADNPIVNMIDQAYRAIDRAERNRYLRSAWDAFVGMERDTPGIVSDIVRFDKGEPKRVIDNKTGLVKWVDDSSFAMSPNTVSLKIDGEQHYLVFENRDIAEAIKRMSPDGLGMFQGLLDLENKLKAMWTHYSPDFLFRHFIFRYPIEGTLNSFEQGNMVGVAKYIKDGFPFLGTASRAIFATNRGERLSSAEGRAMQDSWDLMREEGGAMMFRQSRDMDLLREHLQTKLMSLKGNPVASVREKWRSAIESMDVVTNALDNALRLAAFHGAILDGKTPQEAAFLAREATIDFQLKGRWANAIGLMFPFGNVAIQTGARMTSAVVRSKIMQRVFMGTMMTGFMAAAYNYLVGGDDKDGVPFFEKIPEWDRRLNFIVLNPYDKDDKGRPTPIKIPMPYNWAFPLTLGHAFGTMVFGKEGVRKSIHMALRSGMEVLTPMGQNENMAASFSPELARPAVYLATNRDYADRPIHVESMYQKGPNAYSGKKDVQGRERTGQGWKMLAQAINTASGGSPTRSGYLDFYPEDLRYVVDYVVGSQRRLGMNIYQTGRSLLKGETPDPTHVPLERVIRGTDYDAADRYKAYEKSYNQKHPWLQ